MYNLNDFVPGSVWEGAEKRLEDEPELVRLWKGLTPNAVARAMVVEFVARYSYPFELKNSHPHKTPLDEQALLSTLIPKDNTWYELSKNLKTVARMYDGDKLIYWDAMRSLWMKLPRDNGQRERRAFYRARDNKNEDESQIVKMDVCYLCWRSVPKRRKDAARRTLCRSHDFNCRHPEYRKRYRLRSGVNKSSEFLKPIWAHFDMLRTFNYNNGPRLKNDAELNEDRKDVDYNWGDVWYDYPELLISQLPHVHSYLTNKGVNLDSALDIIIALDDPPDSEPADEAEFRQNFYRKASMWLDVYIDFLAWAEIWLMLEEKHKHGGKRKGAGHPGRENAT